MKQIILILLTLSINSFSSSLLYDKGIKFLEQNNTVRAKIEFMHASKIGHAKAMYKMGLIYEKEHNLTEALHWYKKAKIAGNIKAKYNLGVLSCKLETYQHLNDFEDYAKNSSKIVQYDLAVCFLKKGNVKKAKKWFTVVAKKEDAKAQYQLAILEKNKKIKITWLKKSAKNNYTEAQFKLGKLFFKQQELKQSKYWLNKAKNNGSIKAKTYLKRMKELGL